MALDTTDDSGAKLTDSFRLDDPGGSALLTVYNLTFYPVTFSVSGKIDSYSTIVEFPGRDKDVFKIELKDVGPMASRSHNVWFRQSKNGKEYTRLAHTSLSYVHEEISCHEIVAKDANDVSQTFGGSSGWRPAATRFRITHR